MTDPTAAVPHSSARHVAVIGGGISGLAAALFLRRLGGNAVRVTVFEESAGIGGKLRVSEVGGLPVDEGAEALLVRRPEGVQLVRDVGLEGELVTPATSQAAIWTRGGLRPMPAGNLMGIPGDLRALAASGVLSVPALARLPLDHLLPRTPVEDDVAIGRYVAARLGREVVDRLVEPLLGGVYAGHADELSLDATVPALSQVVRSERSLLAGVDRVRAAAQAAALDPAGQAWPDGSARPVFASLRGGLGRLPAAVAAASGATIRTRMPVRALRRTPTGWQLVTSSARRPEVVDADAVVLALPARPAARLLTDEVPAASAQLAGIDYASVALVTLVLPRAAFRLRPLAGSGFLVPPVERRLVKAATYSTQKWGWLAAADPDLVAVRLSVGRYGEEADLQRSDEELTWLAAADLAAAVGVKIRPLATRVSRWGGSLPQYTVGHRDRVARVRAAVDDAAADGTAGLAVCGAAYEGVGVPACVSSAHAAAAAVLRQLGAGEPRP